MENDTELIERLYEDFNARKIDSIFAKLTEDVMWANGMEGGHIHGQQNLKDYWGRQWSTLNPHIKAIGFSKTEDGGILVDARFSGQAPTGEEFKDIPVGHVFYVKDGLISRFDIHGCA